MAANMSASLHEINKLMREEEEEEISGPSDFIPLCSTCLLLSSASDRESLRYSFAVESGVRALLQLSHC